MPKFTAFSESSTMTNIVGRSVEENERLKSTNAHITQVK